MMKVVSDSERHCHRHDKGSALMMRRSHAAQGKRRTRSNSTDIRRNSWEGGRGGACRNDCILNEIYKRKAAAIIQI